MIQIISAHGPAWLSHIHELFMEYAQSLSFNLCFQNFDDELATLPGDYAPPAGDLLLALSGDKPAGCVSLRRLTDTDCEMKRLFVRPSFRGQAIGKQLARAIIEQGRMRGYQRMLLDTIPAMEEAITLYRSLGFKEIAPYRFNPLEGAIYLGLTL